MSEITRAYAVYKSQQYNASYSAGEWSVDIPSGSESSYDQANHTYPIELHAFDAAGNETIMYATDSTYGDQLNIRVLETDGDNRIPDAGICPWISNAGYCYGAFRCRRIWTEYDVCDI